MPALTFGQAMLPLGSEPPAEQPSHHTSLVPGLRCLVSLELCKVILVSTRSPSGALAECEAGARSHS